MAENRYVVVEGAIGVGKSSLARLLADRMQARLVLEEVEENPFLKDFYRNREHYAFQTQMHFLFSRYQQQRSTRGRRRERRHERGANGPRSRSAARATHRAVDRRDEAPRRVDHLGDRL